MRIGKKNIDSSCQIDCIYLLCLAVIVTLFFLPLFIPELRLFVTPDSKLSDILHFNFPLKDILSTSLKQHVLPIWTNLIGTGFPLIGEAEIGAFSFVNLILFYCFPTPIAFNLGYIVTFLFFAWGMYFVGRELQWGKTLSFFMAFIFTFSGFHIVQIPHYNHLQTLSYLPFLFAIVQHIANKPHTKLWLILPLVISQQIFQGHYQYVYITWISLSLYWLIYLKNRISLPKLFYAKIVVSILIGLGIAAIQLFPSFEYFQYTERGSSFKIFEPVKNGGFALIHILQFLNPYILGDIRNGTFPTTYRMSFWEMFSYIGIIPFLIACISCLLTAKNLFLRSIWILIGILVIVSMDNNTPFTALLTLPPFAWFRIQSRFLAVITFFLIICAGSVIQLILNKYKQTRIKTIIYVLFVISCIDVLYFATSYNPTIPVDKINTSKLYLSLPKSERIGSFDVTALWFDTMYSEGWKNTDKYIHLLDDGTPNYPIIYDIPTAQIYSGFILTKQLALNSFLSEGTVDYVNNVATLSAIAINSFQLNNIKTIFSPHIITNNELVQTRKESLDEKSTMYQYSLQDTKSTYYITDNLTYVPTMTQYRLELDQENILKTTDAFIHTSFPEIPKQSNQTTLKSTLDIVSEKPTEKIVRMSVSKDAFFITSHYFYPGWVAYLNENKIPIYPANLGGMAIHIPKGVHTLKLIYEPITMTVGVYVSGVFVFIYCIVLLYFLQSVNNRKK